MKLVTNTICKPLLLAFLSLLFFLPNASAVKSGSLSAAEEIELNEENILSIMEKNKGKKLNFIEKATAKLMVKRFKKQQEKHNEKEANGNNKNLAIVSFITGIASLLLILVPVIGFLFIPAAIIAVVFGVIARKKARGNPEVYGGKGFALAGLICGIVSLALLLLGIIFVAALLASL